MSKAQIHIRGYLMILLSSVLVGTYGVWSKLMGNKFGIFYQAWVRSVIVLAILLPILYFTKSFRRIAIKDLRWILTTVGFSLFTQVPLYYAFIHTSIGTATLLFYALFIISSYAVGRVFLSEGITLVKLVAIVLAITGLIFTFGFSLEKFSVFGLLMAAFNGIASGAEVATSKKSSEEYPSLLITACCWLGIFIVHLPLSLLTGEKQWAPAPTKEWLAMILYSIAGMLAFWLVIEGFKFVDASLGSLIGLLEIIWGILFGVWFFHEHAGLTVLIGGILIVCAGMLPDAVNLLKHKDNSGTDLL